MSDLESEELLSIEWLNSREMYDTEARSQDILKRVIHLVDHLPIDSANTLTVADLGSGTGNNVLFLHNHLLATSNYQLVEQHDFLLQECQRRCIELIPSLATAMIPGHASIDEWYATHNADLVTNSALLDLFTEPELEALLSHLETREIPMYSTLNYRGITFSPDDPADSYYIGLFEQHMSRPLDRGKPLGANTCETLERLVNSSNQLTYFTAESNWTIPASDSEFIHMNLDFYESGIQKMLNSDSEQKKLAQWISTKRQSLERQASSLTVHHKDYLITPAQEPEDEVQCARLRLEPF